MGKLDDIRLPPKWIELNLTKRECVVFISSQRDEFVCQCGRTKSEHVNAVQHHHSVESWTPSLHTKISQTDAYGTMIFEGGHYPNKARYVRLSYDTNPDLVVELMTLVWGVPLPKLLITIRGGNNNFELTSWLGQLLQTGLIKAAKATNAWILTNGLNKGVAKHIGNAVQKERSMGVKHGRLVTIGISPWGIVENRSGLIGHNKERTYNLLEHTNTRNVILNPRHSNFLLVDNGSLGKFGGESYFRKRLEKYISLLPTSPNRGCDTPIVCVIIEGGFYTLRNISENLYDEPPIPVVVFNGSGRTADLISFIILEIDKGRKLESFKTIIYEKMKSIYKLADDTQCHVFYNEVERICARRNLLTVYSPRSADDEGFDVILLASIFRSQHWTPLQQLSLTLVWDRVDIANNEVFTYGRDWSRENLEHAMMEALVSDRLQFINLLIEHGLNMQTFLTPKRLESLYSIERTHSKIMRSLLFDLLKMHGSHKHLKTIYNPITLHDIGLAINKMMGHIYKSKYVGLRVGRRSSAGHEKRIEYEYEDDDDEDEEIQNGAYFPQPFDDLFIWAVLTKRHSMALLLWPHGPGALAKALIAVKLNRYLGHELESIDTNLSNEFTNYALEWETLSYELLDTCFKSDTKMARQLLTMELESWSKQTCLTLAVNANHRMFLGHPCCQTLLADLWMGALNLKNHAEFKVILGILFPIACFWFDFKSVQELRLLPHQEKRTTSGVGDSVENRHKGHDMGNDDSLDLLSRSNNSFTSSFFQVNDETSDGGEEHKNKGRRKTSTHAVRHFAPPGAPKARRQSIGQSNTSYEETTRHQTKRQAHHQTHGRHKKDVPMAEDNFEKSALEEYDEFSRESERSESSSGSSSSTSSENESKDPNADDYSRMSSPPLPPVNTSKDTLKDEQNQTHSHKHHHHRQPHPKEHSSSSDVQIPDRKNSLIEDLVKQATKQASQIQTAIEAERIDNLPKKRQHGSIRHYDSSLAHKRGVNTYDEEIPMNFETTKKELNYWNKFYEFHKAPVTNFSRHTIAYLVFVCCLSYTILIPQHRMQIGVVETYVILYLVTLGIDIIREFLLIDAYNWSQRVNELKSKTWTICDLCFIIVFMIGVTLRFHTKVDLLMFRYGMLIYRVSSIYWNLRLYKYMGAHKFLGPKLVMMSRMLKHMAYFAVIIFVVLLSFGLAREAIRYPDKHPSWRNIETAFLEPYVMMFGEIDSDSLLQCGEGDHEPCPVGHWVVPLIWIIYMMVANILIVNVLIAVFNGIYSEVDSIAIELWLFQRFTFVMEFERKPVLPPPFVILCHLYYIVKWIYGACFNCFCEGQFEEKGYDYNEPRQVILGNDHSLKTFLSPNEINQAFDFELDNVDTMYSCSKEENETTNVLRKAGIIGIGTKIHVAGGFNEHQVFVQSDNNKIETVKGFAQLRTQIKEFGAEIESQRTKLDKLIGLFETRYVDHHEQQKQPIIVTTAITKK